MSQVKDAVLALLGVDDPVSEPALPVAPPVEIEVLVCPHCDCPNCEVWSTTTSRMADCPQCGAVFTPMRESETMREVKAITEARERMRRRIGGPAKPKMELHKFLKDD